MSLSNLSFSTTLQPSARASGNTTPQQLDGLTSRILLQLHYPSGNDFVVKMASHAIFQYNVLVINDTHNTWTNTIIKMTILRLLG